jgi:hypothetical protein
MKALKMDEVSVDEATLTLSAAVWDYHYERLGECVAQSEGGRVEVLRNGKTTVKVRLNRRSLEELLADTYDYAQPSYWDDWSERSWLPYERAYNSIVKQLTKEGNQ